MVFLDDTYKISEIADNRDNTVTYNMDIAINNQEDALIKRSVLTQGYYASGYRWYLKHTHPALILEDIQERMMQISTLSKLIDYKIENVDTFENDPRLTYDFSTEKFLNPASDLRIVPALDQFDLRHDLIAKSARNFPIDFQAMQTKSANISIDLPKNLKVKFLPKSKTLENPWFKVNISYQKNKNGLEFHQEFTIKSRFVEVKDYQKFSEEFKQALYFMREEIILEKVE